MIEEETGQDRNIVQKDNSLQQPIYSSIAPKYEQVELVQANYDVIDRSRVQPSTVPTASHDPTSDEDYATLSYNKQENDYHVLEMTREPMGGTSQDHSSQQNDGNQEETKANQKGISEIGKLI